MFRDLLAVLADGEAHTQASLAARLDVPPALVEQMVAQLVEAGYLEAAPQCHDACARCPMRAVCGVERKLRLWVLTEKGRRAVKPGG